MEHLDVRLWNGRLRRLFRNPTGAYSASVIRTHCQGGASSVDYKLKQNVGQNFYVPPDRGPFVGQSLYLTKRVGTYSGGTDTGIVSDLGVDSGGRYFVANINKSYPQNTIIYNKNAIDAIYIEDVSNCDNQSASLVTRSSRAAYQKTSADSENSDTVKFRT